MHRQKSERAIKPEKEPKLPQGRKRKNLTSKKNLNHYKTYGYTRAQRLADLTRIKIKITQKLTHRCARLTGLTGLT